ncbi:hypothetical protein ABID95_001302 [Streptomyces atratus]|uniref:hypothetical protein n=1 Tax=Streptomyces atratus TaxID=1893 RepID=UPI003392B4C9
MPFTRPGGPVLPGLVHGIFEDLGWRAAYDQVAAGLAAYQRDAMVAYADARLS